ncbi:MAG: hypothetical protein RIS64_1822 [Bacteroidota bacterium]|jgi:hypothetical protein
MWITFGFWILDCRFWNSHEASIQKIKIGLIFAKLNFVLAKIISQFYPRRAYLGNYKIRNPKSEIRNQL